MKSLTLVAGLSILLLIAQGCSSAGPANNTANTTNTTNRTTTTTTTNSSAPSNAADTASSNTASSNNSSNADSSQAGKQDFTLVNETGVEIHKVYISPHDKDDWEEDILGRDTLPSGQSVDIKFHRNESAAMWDLRVEDSKGGAIEWENLNLLEISKLTLHYNNGKATADVQ